MFKTMHIAAQLKAAPAEDRKWLYESTLRLANDELQVQTKKYHEGDPKAQGRVNVLRTAIKLLRTLDV